MLIEYAATEMGFLDDYSDADPNHKSIRGNGITTFLFHVAQYILFHLTNCVKTILIANASLKSFCSRLGFTVIKDFVTSTTFEAAHSRFHSRTCNWYWWRQSMFCLRSYSITSLASSSLVLSTFSWSHQQYNSSETNFLMLKYHLNLWTHFLSIYVHSVVMKKCNTSWDGV